MFQVLLIANCIGIKNNRAGQKNLENQFAWSFFLHSVKLKHSSEDDCI